LACVLLSAPMLEEIDIQGSYKVPLEHMNRVAKSCKNPSVSFVDGNGRRGNLEPVTRHNSVSRTDKSDNNLAIFRLQRDGNSKAQIPKFKIVLLADSGVGSKTSLLKKLKHGTFSEGETKPTVGAKSEEKIIEIDDKTKCILEIIDVGGDEKFRSLHQTYISSCDGIIFGFDLTNVNSFENVPKWHAHAMAAFSSPSISSSSSSSSASSGPQVSKVLVAHKYDLPRHTWFPGYDKRYVDKLARDLGLKWFYTSAKTGDNLHELFMWLANDIYQRKKKQATI